jgi:hypothetical protein
MAARAQRPIERHDEQKRNPDCGELANRAHLVASVGIDHGERGGQLRLGDVVVDHDDLLTARGGGRERLERRGAGIQRDHEPAALLSEPLQRASVGSVAFAQSVRDVDRGGRPEGREIARQDGDRGGAVDVVVAEQTDALARLHRIGEALDRDVETEQMRRVGQGVAQLRRDEGGNAIERDPAPGEHPAHDLRQIEALADGERRRGVVPAPAPAPAADRALDRGCCRIWGPAQAANSGTTSRLRAM